MGDGPFQLRSGKFLVGPNGKFTVHSDCCCNCAHCSGPTPAQYSVTISGNLPCNYCYPANDGGILSIKPTSGFNGTAILTQTPGDPCLWTGPIYGDATNLRYDYWNSSSCPGSPAGNNAAASGIIYLRRYAGNVWDLLVSSGGDIGSGSYPGLSGDMINHLFEAFFPGACGISLGPIANDLVIGNCGWSGQFRWLAYGGTATIVPV